MEQTLRIFCDFDGTISRQDTTDLVLSRLADPEWLDVEAEWDSGRIDAATCMSRQIGLIRAPLSAIDAVLDEVELRDGFVDLLGWARRRGIRVSIVSDGVDYFIRSILSRHGIAGLPIVANRLITLGVNRWALEQPWRTADCTGGSGVCKCSIVATFEDDRPLVYIGDGRSDFCVATTPDLLFATAGLERFCCTRGIAHFPFTSFAEVQSALARIAVPARAIAALA